jgi:hypothetical protein
MPGHTFTERDRSLGAPVLQVVVTVEVAENGITDFRPAIELLPVVV